MPVSSPTLRPHASKIAFGAAPPNLVGATHSVALLPYGRMRKEGEAVPRPYQQARSTLRSVEREGNVVDHGHGQAVVIDVDIVHRNRNRGRRRMRILAAVRT